MRQAIRSLFAALPAVTLRAFFRRGSGRGRGRRSVGVRVVCMGVAALAAGGCYAQQPLPREPTYVPASWEPILGLTTRDGEELSFDEPASVEGGRVVYRVEGSRGSVSLGDVQRLMVGRKTLDKPKTVAFAAVFLTAFGFFFASVGSG